MSSEKRVLIAAFVIRRKVSTSSLASHIQASSQLCVVYFFLLTTFDKISKANGRILVD